MKILICDTMNLLHRARSGFTLGDYPVVYNFFRGFKALVEAHKPTRVVLALEGHPKRRHELLAEYKANRELDPTSETYERDTKELDKFFAQVAVIVDMLHARFPVSVVRHPDWEADDTIYNLIKRGTTAVPVTVVSTDSDFFQLLDEFEHVDVYNPISKKLVERPDFDYVTWKALKGDASDNVPALMNEESANLIVNDPDALASFLSDQANAKTFTRNYELIKFATWSDDEADKMTCSEPKRDWDYVKGEFEEMGFKSMTKDTYWNKFLATFDPLFGKQ